MKLDARIDYIAILQSAEIYPEIFTNDNIVAVPQQGYTNAKKYIPDGRVSSLNPDRPDMMVHIRYSGKTLLELEKSMNAHEIMKFHYSMNAQGIEQRFTRLDLAIDVRDSEFSVQDYAKLIRRGEYKARAKKPNLIDGFGNGDTLYIGSRQSERMLRIYDKAKEQGINGDWIRIELEIKGKKSRSHGRAIASMDVSVVGTYIANCIIKFVQFDCDVWDTLNAVPQIELAKTDKIKGSNTREWLLTQIPKAVRKVYENGDKSIVYDLIDALMNELDSNID